MLFLGGWFCNFVPLSNATLKFCLPSSSHFVNSGCSSRRRAGDKTNKQSTTKEGPITRVDLNFRFTKTRDGGDCLKVGQIERKVLPTF